MGERPRLLFHVQHLLGVGHRNRAQRIAEACRAAGFAVTVTTDPAAAPDGVEALPLPAIRAADAGFSALVDADGRPVSEALWAERARRLAAAVAADPPDVLLVEGYPFARRRLGPEIEPLIAQARRAGARVACSIRDILVEKPDAARNRRTAERAAALYDAILVHGDPDFVRLEASFPEAARLADRLHYTGYVAPPADRAEDAAEPDGAVVVSAGGGAVGAALLEAALDARAGGLLADRSWRLLAGPNLPSAAAERLMRRAGAQTAGPRGAALEPALSGPAFRAALAGAALSISQAGYNTVVDLWRTGPPAVLVPFAGPEGSETEQPLRARLMAAAGEAAVVSEAALSGAALARAATECLAAPRPGPAARALDGAAETARRLAALAAGARAGLPSAGERL
ncbi:MAG: glycosyl transferase [Alphaproteobacteria bacterium]|nr:glycosyl transferase [Alphaproteobacteria bacterium]